MILKDLLTALMARTAWECYVISLFLSTVPPYFSHQKNFQTQVSYSLLEMTFVRPFTQMVILV